MEEVDSINICHLLFISHEGSDHVTFSWGKCEKWTFLSLKLMEKIFIFHVSALGKKLH